MILYAIETNELDDTRSFEYDNLGWLTGQRWLQSDQMTLAGMMTFAYNALSQLTSAGDDDSDYTDSYDAAGYLTQVGTSDRPDVVLAYTYDAAPINACRTNFLWAVITETYCGASPRAIAPIFLRCS